MGKPFSAAVAACEAGSRIRREGWPAGMFVVYQKGYPEGIRINQNTADATGYDPGTLCRFSPYFMAWGSPGCFYPWTPSQVDMVTQDWVVGD